MRSRPCGFTLAELLVALVLTTLVGTVVLRLLLSTQRASTAQAERVQLQGSLRTGAQVLQAELRELSADAGGTQSDLLHIAAESVTYRAARGFGVTCAVGPAKVKLLDTPELPFSAVRGIAPGRDSLLLFVEGDAATGADDGWVRLPISGVAATTCGTRPALGVSTPGLVALLPGGSLAAVEVGGPVRTEEVMRLKGYPSGGRHWVGAASLSGNDAVQPILGPIAPGGFRLAYFTATGGVATSPTAVRQVRMTLIGMGERAVSRTGGTGGLAILQDTLEVRVVLRNAPR